MNIYWMLHIRRSFSINSSINYNLYSYTIRRRNMTKKWIFSTGELLQAVQLSEIFSDQRSFLKKKLKHPIDDVLSNFYNLKKEFGGTIPSSEAMKSFIKDNFEDQPATEPWEPPDWIPFPNFMNNIQDPLLKRWAIELNHIWKTIGITVTKMVFNNPESFAAYSLPHGYISTESRMNSMPYWSSYWIINGLLVCGMHETAKGMIKNLLFLLNKIGHIPISSLMFYEGRTNIPMMTLIFESYLLHTKDIEFIKANLGLLIKELEFWEKDRTIKIKYKGSSYTFYRYYRNVAGPRPENYRDDLLLTSSLGVSRKEMIDKYIAIQGAVESGWLYSSRWIIVRGGNKGNLSDIGTHYILPVDLNAILQRSFFLIAKWSEEFGDRKHYDIYKYKSEELLNAIEKVMWSEKEGTWFDYDIIFKKKRKYFYLSNFTPLWTQSYTINTNTLTKRTTNYLNNYFMDKYEGGLPSSVELSGEKWDFPNVWPPLQAFVIQGFDKLHTEDGVNLSYHFAEKWVNAVYKGYKETGKLYEKYDSLLVGRGDASEQTDTFEGFGWTLGFTFEMLSRWGPFLKLDSEIYDKRS